MRTIILECPYYHNLMLLTASLYLWMTSLLPMGHLKPLCGVPNLTETRNALHRGTHRSWKTGRCPQEGIQESVVLAAYQRPAHPRPTAQAILWLRDNLTSSSSPQPLPALNPTEPPGVVSRPGFGCTLGKCKTHTRSQRLPTKNK